MPISDTCCTSRQQPVQSLREELQHYSCDLFIHGKDYRILVCNIMPLLSFLNKFLLCFRAHIILIFSKFEMIVIDAIIIGSPGAEPMCIYRKVLEYPITLLANHYIRRHPKIRRQGVHITIGEHTYGVSEAPPESLIPLSL